VCEVRERVFEVASVLVRGESVCVCEAKCEHSATVREENVVRGNVS